VRTRVYVISAIAIVLVLAAVEYGMGRVPICKCGYVKLWHGVVYSSENSQHLTDWYTPSHVIHGIAFYALLWAVARRMPVGARFVTAVFLESCWELLENTPLIINRYREGTIALDYFGDSIINSVSDVLAMSFGFWLARKLPIWASIALVVVLELTVGAIIRDNLTLNILMLIHPFEAVKRWQMGG